MNLTDLIGLRIDAAYSRFDSVFLACDTGRIVRLETVGDCCARAFIQHIDNAQALVGAEILDVEDLHHTAEMLAAIKADKEESDYDESYDIWGHRFITTQGTCVFDCRTSHNGYYSGWMEADWCDGVPAGATPLEDR